MSRRSIVGSIVVLAATLAVSTSCNHGPARVLPPSINASAAGSQAIEMFDTNKDGKISGDELDKCPGLKAALAKVDPNSEGGTADKITARIREWQESKIGLMPVHCTITRNGEPLEGAEVRFVPEKFLGDNMKVASGKTSGTGMVMITVPAAKPTDLSGVPPGFYRVEITKQGLTIPAKYNTETTLGQEVALDSEALRQGGIRFDLKF
jgi:hypothetical protein